MAASLCLWVAAKPAAAQTISVTKPSGFAVSPRVIDLPDDDKHHRPTRPHHPLPDHGNGNGQNGDDPVRQHNPEPPVKAFPHAYFGGIGADGVAPPDTNIAVGPNHIVETVNVEYAIYSKTGALLVGPKSLDSLWAALGGGCATNIGGDPIVQYDRAADRWLITQLGSTFAPFSQCIAVSQTSDPAGAYYLYSYDYGSTLNDYPKFGVWPTATNSAYLYTANLFADAAVFTGGQLCAYDRSAMLSGAALPLSICYTVNNDGGYLPVDLDGATPPLDGTPGYFINFETTSSLRVYTFAPNFANPNASVVTQVTPDLRVAAFNEACGGGTCIPQPGTNQQLDSISDRLMYRLAFRRFADHEAMVVNHSVATGSTVGVRWYELRAPVSSTGTFSVFQQGTFSPADGTYRWMGSAAMDQAGDIAVGYSASSSSVHPAIRYTGREPGDPAGTMGTEASLLEGRGSQTGGLSRWGDYTALRIDPTDDCTFWYSNEYLPANGSYNWSTFIGSFKFSGCVAVPDFSISTSPVTQTVIQGASASYTVTVTPSRGYTGTVNLSASGLPSGVNATFSPQSVTGGSGSSTMSVTAGSTTPIGSFTVTIMGTDATGMPTHSTAVTLVVNGPPTISLSPSSLDFGNVPVGNSSDKNFTVQNSGGGVLTGNASTNPPYSIVSGASYSLSAGQSQTVTIRFSPTSIGTFPGNVNFTGGAGTSATVNGNGIGVSSITPNSIDLAAPPASFTIAGNGFTNSGFGLPVINFTRSGTVLAQARATSGTNTSLTVPFPTDATSIGGSHPGLSAGAVTTEVYNRTGTSSFSLVGTTSLTVNDTRGVSSITPNPIDLAAPPASFTIAGSGFTNSGFGLPVINFTRSGFVLAQARATSGTNTSLTVPFPTDATSIGGSHPGLSAGAVTAEVYNQTGTSSFSLVGTISLTVNDTRGVSSITPNPIDLAAPPASFTIAGSGFTNSGFGLPAINFTRSGFVLAQARATSGTNTSLTVPLRPTTGY